MAKAQILVVEDEGIVAEEIRSRLESLKYKIPAVAFSGEEAIEKAEEIHPDLVLMDIKLKGSMDGVTAAEQIRARFSIPVVFVTAYADEETLRRAKMTEPYGYIMKPFKEEELHINIEVALYKHSIDRTIRNSLQSLATMLRSMSEAMIAADTEGRVMFMNPLAEAMTGWRQG